MTVFDGRFAQWLKESRPLLGIFIPLNSPALVEMSAYAGFQYVIIDNEHGPAGFENTEHMIRAAKASGIVPLVRVSSTSQQEILRTLDIGASGVQVPQVNTAEQARMTVSAAKYPPIGTRGVAFSTRSAGYGFYGGLAHVESSNRDTVVIVHIETREAVENLDEIVKVEGVDVLFIGPTDLSVSMGFAGRQDHPEVQSTIADCIHRISAAGKVAGILVSSIDEYHKYAALGAKYLAMNSPTLIRNALSEAVRGTIQR